MSYEKIVINSVLEESISSYYAILKQQKIPPEISITDTKLVGLFNRNALSRIFSNIIDNTIKYSDGDLSISLSENGEIIFSNHASGLTEVQVRKLFNRFYTVSTARKSTGLGLSIAKMLTEEMGGTIAACYHENIISIHISFDVEKQIKC
ncbi:sensor histidine kinase [Amphibacillus sp. Q70]|uniref:sensor histidine kinase n=1 Tax=Amphibacillus sp. Q70 TaxID=3453416 RepID=UPI003F8752C9